MQRAQPDDDARHAGVRPDPLIRGRDQGNATGTLFMHQRLIDQHA